MSSGVVLDDDAVQVREIPGRGGFGLFAARDFAIGSVIVRERACVRWKSDPVRELFGPTVAAATDAGEAAPTPQPLGAALPTAAVREALRRLFPRSLTEIPAERADEYRQTAASLQCVQSGALLVDEAARMLVAVDLNGFASGIFPTISYINHACRPNCVKFEPDRHGFSEVRAVLPIRTGDEITLSYLAMHEGLAPRSLRRTLLRAEKMFDCACALCTHPLPYLESLRCVQCDGDVPAGTAACSRCGSLPACLDSALARERELAGAAAAAPDDSGPAPGDAQPLAPAAQAGLLLARCVARVEDAVRRDIRAGDAPAPDDPVAATERLGLLLAAETLAAATLHPLHVSLARLRSRIVRAAAAAQAAVARLGRLEALGALCAIELRALHGMRRCAALYTPPMDPHRGLQLLVDTVTALERALVVRGEALEAVPDWSTPEQIQAALRPMRARIDEIETLFGTPDEARFRSQMQAEVGAVPAAETRRGDGAARGVSRQRRRK